MMHYTQRLAENNGRVAAECGLSVETSNPYRKRAKAHAAFIRGHFRVTENARLFIVANVKSPVTSANVIGQGGEGAWYTLRNGKEFKLTAFDLTTITPRWAEPGA